MTVGLALIARNEQAALPRLLASVQGAFDEVVLVDTGSDDGTTRAFAAWADGERRRDASFRSQVAAFAWGEDFAAARNFAGSLLRTEWKAWADADDEIRGARRLRGLACAAPRDLAAFKAGYRGAENGTGQALAYVKRVRLVRAGAGRWQGRVHEALTVSGRVAEISPEAVEWVHQGDFKWDARESVRRNLSLLERWAHEDPDNPHVLTLLGDSCVTLGRHREAVGHFNRFLGLRPQWGPTRARVHRRLAVALMALGRHAEALELARQAARAIPTWAESHLTMAEAQLALGQPARAIEAAQHVLRLGPPQTDLVVRPLDFSLRPRMLIASALRRLGREDESAEVGRQVLDACFSEAPPRG